VVTSVVSTAAAHHDVALYDRHRRVQTEALEDDRA
jgi:hypothetical protein